MKRQLDMTEGSPGKLLLSFAVPLLIGNLFQQMYSFVDRIIVGRFVGATAFSAVGATNGLSLMFMSICMGMAMGTGVVVAQYYGARDEQRTAAVIANSTYFNSAMALLMTVISLLLTRPMLILLNTPESLIGAIASI